MSCSSGRLFPTHSGIQSGPKGEGCAHVLTRSLRFALLRFELRLAGVPLCPGCLSLLMRRGETDGQIFFNHHNEGIPMSEQTTHSTNDTVVPQFLGPEAGQQAEGGGKRVSELDANGTELHRYFSVTRGALISIRSNGVTLCRQVDDDWKVLSRKKVDCSLAQWVANKKAALGSLSRWQLEVEDLPSMQELMAWNEDGICETPTGHRVEPDGTGPDGVPSWLRAMRLI